MTSLVPRAKRWLYGARQKRRASLHIPTLSCDASHSSPLALDIHDLTHLSEPPPRPRRHEFSREQQDLGCVCHRRQRRDARIYVCRRQAEQAREPPRVDIQNRRTRRRPHERPERRAVALEGGPRDCPGRAQALSWC